MNYNLFAKYKTKIAVISALAFSFIVIKYCFGIVFPIFMSCLICYVFISLNRKIILKENKFLIILLLIVFYFVCFILLYLFFKCIISLSHDLTQSFSSGFSEKIKEFTTLFEKFLRKKDIYDVILERFNSFILFFSKEMAKIVSKIISKMPDLIISLCFSITLSFYLCLNAGKIKKYRKNNFSECVKQIAVTVKDTILQMIFAFIIISGITFALLFLGLKLLDIKNSFLISFLLTIFDSFPILSVSSFLFPWAMYCFFTKKYAVTVGLISISLIISIIKSLIEPKIIGKKIGQNPIITLLLIFVGYKVSSVLGMIFFPIYGVIYKKICEVISNLHCQK